MSPDATKRVLRDMFVDDLITGADSVEEGQRIVEEMKLLLGSTGFKLTKWSSNDTDILRHIDSTDLAPAIRNITGEEIFQPGKERQKTLGLAWDTNTDQLFVKKPDFDWQNSCPLTMRRVLSCNHQLFDPLGLWSPLYVKMNLCCSKIMRNMTEWDEEIPDELSKEWRKCIDALAGLEQVPIPRRRVPATKADCDYEFHVFADSSKDIAAAAVYLRAFNDNECSVSLVAAKTAIFSRHEMARGSIPRKEFIALDIGARLLTECINATTLPISRCELWTDSQTVQRWCASDTLELRIFERNRVDAILKRTIGQLPRYVPTDENPADIATRGCRINDADKWSFWLSGPQFLSHCGSLQRVCSPEEAEQYVGSLQASSKCSEGTKIEFMANALSRTNDLSKALRTVCKVIECYNTWKIRALKKDTSPETDLPVNYRRARLVLIRAAQSERFGQILEVMKNGASFKEAIDKRREVSPAIRSLEKYVPFLDNEDILRIFGRLEYASNLTDEAKHPAILPSDHHVTKLFIFDRHKAMAH